MSKSEKLFENFNSLLNEEVKSIVDYKSMTSEQIIVISEDGELVYSATPGQIVKTSNPLDTNIIWDLTLVGGKNYVDVDDKYNNKQGVIEPDNFIEDVQTEQFSQYIVQESFKQAAEANGYKLVNEF